MTYLLGKGEVLNSEEVKGTVQNFDLQEGSLLGEGARRGG